LIALVLNATVGGYYLRFALDCVIGSLEGSDQAPNLPEFRIAELFLTGLKGMGIYLVYILPVVTIPLLPLGLLGLGYANDGRAFNLLWAAKAAAKRPGQLLLLWLMLLLWGGLAYVGCSLLTLAVIAAAAAAMVTAGCFVMLLVFAVGMLVVSVVAWMFICVKFRCIGMLGRMNPVLTDMMPAEPSIGASMIYLGAGGAASAVLWWQIIPIIRPG